MINRTVKWFNVRKGVGFMKRISGYIAIALGAVCTMWVGTVHATLIGDTVTVGHYFPDSATPQIGATPPSSFAVQAGSADIYTFYNSFPFGYQVNVEANSILVDFNYLRDAAGTWAADYQSCSFIPPVGCSTVPASFNGLGVSGLDDSSGGALQSVAVNTNMGGWNSSSRLSFGSDYVQFDWKGLSFTNATTFEATLSFGPSAVPEPETYAMLGLGLGLLGWVGRRRKLQAA